MGETSADKTQIRMILEADLQSLRALPLLRGFSDRRLVALLKTARLMHFGSGEVLFRADEPLCELYYLLSGELGATRPRAGGQEDVVDILLPVRPLCLPTVLLGLPAPIGARTLTGGHLITLSAGLLREIMASDPKLMRSVFDDAMRDAHDLAVVHYSGRMRTVAQRLGEYLLGLIDDPEAKPVRFILPYDNDQLAARLACTKEGITEAFVRLRRSGVQKSNRAVVVRDVAALNAYVLTSGQPMKRPLNPKGRPRKLAVTEGAKAASPPVAPPSVKAAASASVGKRICKVPGCEKPVLARGYCTVHYYAAKPICKAPGCAKRSVALGYCGTHYQRWKSHGDLNSAFRPPRAPRDQRLNGKGRTKGQSGAGSAGQADPA